LISSNNNDNAEEVYKYSQTPVIRTPIIRIFRSYGQMSCPPNFC